MIRRPLVPLKKELKRPFPANGVLRKALPNIRVLTLVMFVWQLPKHILFASVALEGFIDSWHTLSMAFMQAVQTNEVVRHVFFIQVQTKQSTSMKAREAGHLRHLNTFKIFTLLPNPDAMHLWDAGSHYFQCACSVANQRGGHVQRPAWAVKRTLWPVMRHHTHSMP